MKLIIITVVLNLCIASAFAEKFAVVVNKKNSDKVDVKKFFLLNNESWNSVGKVVVYEMKKSSAHQAFITKVLKMDKASYQTHWNDRKSSGKTTKPTNVKSASYMFRFIKNKKGAIGYLPESKAAGLRIITTFDVP
jgi:hypothetical protein